MFIDMTMGTSPSSQFDDTAKLVHPQAIAVVFFAQRVIWMTGSPPRSVRVPESDEGPKKAAAKNRGRVIEIIFGFEWAS
jgi:hypothetical protein